jgi:hypothetical protein
MEEVPKQLKVGRATRQPGGIGLEKKDHVLEQLEYFFVFNTRVTSIRDPRQQHGDDVDREWSVYVVTYIRKLHPSIMSSCVLGIMAPLAGPIASTLRFVIWDTSTHWVACPGCCLS